MNDLQRSKGPTEGIVGIEHAKSDLWSGGDSRLQPGEMHLRCVWGLSPKQIAATEDHILKPIFCFTETIILKVNLLQGGSNFSEIIFFYIELRIFSGPESVWGFMPITPTQGNTNP
jgi:hypothetical protein